MEFSRQDYWSSLPLPSPGMFPTQESNLCLLCFLHWQVGSSPLAPSEKPRLRDRTVQTEAGALKVGSEHPAAAKEEGLVAHRGQGGWRSSLQAVG